VLDSEGIELASMRTAIADNFQAIVPLRFSKPGTYSVQFYYNGEDEPFEDCIFEVRLPMADASQPS